MGHASRDSQDALDDIRRFINGSSKSAPNRSEIESLIRANPTILKAIGAKPEELELAKFLITNTDPTQIFSGKIVSDLITQFQGSQQPTIEVPGAEQPRSDLLKDIDNTPGLADLPEEVKQQIANDPTHPLNPRNNKNIFRKDVFGDQAAAEQLLKQEQASRQQQQITDFAGEFSEAVKGFGGQLSERLLGFEEQERTNIEQERVRRRETLEQELSSFRGDLATSRQKTFEQANPFILEDLNTRGLFGSETAIANAQSQALTRLQATDESRFGQARFAGGRRLEELRAGDVTRQEGARRRVEEILGGFQTRAFGQEQELLGGGLEALIGGEQEALDSALALSRSRIQTNFDLSQSAADRLFARNIAKKNQQSSLIGSGIQAGGNILSSLF